MTIKFIISMMKGGAKRAIITLVIAFLITSLNVYAQEQRPFAAHEVIEIGGGQKIEILRCRGEGPLEECDCIYYTDKRQNGKRQWQNANQIRQEQKAAQLEVAAAKELAKSEAQKMAEAKAREAADRKAAKEKERTASAETNAVLETIKDQNEQKSKGVIKANTYRGSAALAKQKEQAEEKRKNALSLQEIARQRDSINRLKAVKQDELVQSDTEEEEPTVNKAQLIQPISPVKKEPVKKAETIANQNEVKATVSEKSVAIDTSDVVDFETLRKQEEAKGNVSYVPPAKTETEEKPVQKDNNKKENEAEKSVEPKSETPTPEQEPAPKPAKPETPVVDTVKQELIIDTASTEGNVEVPPTDTTVSPESDTTHKAADTEVKSDENGGQITDENVSETIKNEMVENEENIVKDEEVKKEKVKKEKKEKKPKKPKKDKKKKDEEVAEVPPTEEHTPLEEKELTPLQKIARTSDSILRSKSKTDTTTAPEPPQENFDFGKKSINHIISEPEIIVSAEKLWMNKNNNANLLLQKVER